MSRFDVFGIYTLLAVIYMTPSILAFHTGHPKALIIFLLNLLLGWTVIGWTVSLAWSCRVEPSRPF